MDSPLQTFYEEADELLAELEATLLDLERTPGDPEHINRCFRAIHTIKGSSSMFALDDITWLSHELETVFEHLRNHNAPASCEIINLTLQACDRLRGMLKASREGVVLDLGDETALQEAMQAAIANSKPVEKEGEGNTDGDAHETAVFLEEKTANEDMHVYHIRFRPAGDIFLKGIDPLKLMDELSSLGKAKITINTESIPDMDDIISDHCYPLWDITLVSLAGKQEINDIFTFVQDDCELEIMMETPENKDSLFGAQCGPVGGRRHDDKFQSSAPSVRVPTDKLDALVNLVGEMVTVQAGLTQLSTGWEEFDILGSEDETISVKTQDISRLITLAERVERLVGELRDSTMNIRMLPVGTTFNIFRRLVRDLSIQLGKEVELHTSGGATELDKTVLEQLHDPLIHLIRNAIDHGIEKPEERLRAGKPLQGMVTLTAEYSGASVLLHVSDDGAGIDREAVSARARERGLLKPDGNVSEESLHAAIMEAGFSTAGEVTNVSGRGVGMDIVKKKVEALSGQVRIKSTPGQGTTITMQIPLTLAIIDGLLVRVGAERYIIPLSDVLESVEFSLSDATQRAGRQMARVRDEMVPYISLRSMFHINGGMPERQFIVITRKAETRVGLMVDDVIGEYQTVIKSLGPLYGDLRCFCGGTILGDGAVALILDVQELQQMQRSHDERLIAAGNN